MKSNVLCIAAGLQRTNTFSSFGLNNLIYTQILWQNILVKYFRQFISDIVPALLHFMGLVVVLKSLSEASKEPILVVNYLENLTVFF